VFSGRAAISYDHEYDAKVFYLGLAFDPAYIDGFVEGCLERIGEDDPDGEALFRDLWEDEGERETVLTMLQAECEIFWQARGLPSLLGRVRWIGESTHEYTA